MKRRPRRTTGQSLLAICSNNKALLFVLAFFLITQFVSWPALYWDEAAYLANADTLFRDGNYYEAYRAPLMPVLIGITWFFTGESLLAARMISIVAALVCIVLAYELARPSRYAIAIAFLVAVSHQFLFWSATTYTEALSIALVLGSLLAFKHKRYVITGLLVGLATIARFEYALLAIILGAAVFLRDWRAWKNTAGYVLGGVLIMIPWMSFNYFVNGGVFTDAILSAHTAHAFSTWEPPMKFVGLVLSLYASFFLLLIGKHERPDATTLACTAAFIAYMIFHLFFLEFKIPRYTLAIFPFLIVLAAGRVRTQEPTPFYTAFIIILVLFASTSIPQVYAERETCDLTPVAIETARPYVTNETIVLSTIWPHIGYYLPSESRPLYSEDWRDYERLNRPHIIIYTEPYGHEFPREILDAWVAEEHITLVQENIGACGIVRVYDISPSPERERLLALLGL